LRNGGHELRVGIMAEKRPALRIKDDPTVTEVYANKIVSLTFDGHAVMITFGCGRIVPEPPEEEPSKNEGTAVCVNCRIALSPPAAMELIKSISNMVVALQKAQAQAQKPAADPN
jgi:hypothetical protein